MTFFYIGTRMIQRKLHHQSPPHIRLVTTSENSIPWDVWKTSFTGHIFLYLELLTTSIILWRSFVNHFSLRIFLRVVSSLLSEYHGPTFLSRRENLNLGTFSRLYYWATFWISKLNSHITFSKLSLNAFRDVLHFRFLIFS